MSESWDPGRSFGALGDAVDSNDRVTVRALIQSLVAYVYSNYGIYAADKAEGILNVLRRRRLFEEMRDAADAFLNNGCSTFTIRKLYAQALLDLGYLAAAEDVLTHLRNDADAVFRDTAQGLDERGEAEEDWAEACGLLGRLHKDRYVNAHAPRVKRNQEALNLAIAHYYNCYTADKNKTEKRHWHGINAVALARLARKHRVPLTTEFDIEATAKTILEEVQQQQSEGRADIWATANAMEACIALGRRKGAYRWAKEYADPVHSDVDAFEIGGTLRQLEQVWELDVQHEPGSLLIPLLRARLIDLEGFDFRLGQQEPISDKFLSNQADILEAAFGGNFLSFRVYCEGIRRAKAVARIGPSSEEPFGTGFLVDGADLDPRLENQRLLVTCDHVVSSTDYRALRPNRAVVTFRADDSSIRRFGVRSIVWSRPEGNLDVSILRLDGDVGDLPSVCWAQGPPEATEQRVLIFGHAEGGALSFSFGDNRLVDRNDRFLQYRAPTVHGSSGSPVFNSAWELIGVHHSGGRSLPRLSSDGTHEANEGSSVFAIRQAIQNEPTLSLG